MHYTDAIAQLRALGFSAVKMGAVLRITHRDTRTFDLRYKIDQDGHMPAEFNAWLEATKRQLMPKPTLADFKPGTRFRHKTADHTEAVWTVTENFGNRVTAVATQDVTNPDEWEIVK